jgi:hypothetical protein
MVPLMGQCYQILYIFSVTMSPYSIVVHTALHCSILYIKKDDVSKMMDEVWILMDTGKSLVGIYSYS